LSRRWLHKFELKPGCWVFVPDNETIERGREIKSEIEAHWAAPSYYAHLNSGGHVEALRKHLGSRLFIRADINQFFNQINRTRVTRHLKEILGSYRHGRQLADESVVRLPNASEKKFILPFGFVQSAIIASLCLRKSALGNYLEDLSRDGFIVSVYMDDIIISTCHDKAVADVALARLCALAEKSGLPLNPKKTVGPAEEVTAFNIRLGQGVMEVSSERLSGFQKSISSSPNESHINGVIGYVRTLCKDQADFLLSSLSS